VGLTLFAAHPQDEWWDFEIPPDRQSAGRCGAR
jgi:cell division protein FtsA